MIMKSIPAENLAQTIKFIDIAVKNKKIELHDFGIVFSASSMDKIVLFKDGTWGMTNVTSLASNT